MSDFTASELRARARIQKQVEVLPVLLQIEDKESDCHADAIEALDQLEAAQDNNE